MIESFNFFRVGELGSINELINAVDEFDNNKWTLFYERKLARGVAAENTDTIPLLYDPKSLFPIKHKDFSKFEPFVSEINAACAAAFGNCTIKQAMLTRLQPGVCIPRHKDKGPITAKTHRVHVAIRTNKDCWFTVDEESVNMLPGEIWVIDNVGKYHSVSNSGTTARIHLIVDLLDYGIIKQ